MMAAKVSRVDVWAGEVEDRPGGLAAKLEPLSDAKANLEFVIARRSDDKPGTTVVFLSPLKGVKQTRAAADIGFSKATNMWSLRLECQDRPGLGAKIARAMGNAGINMRGISAAALNKRSVVYFAFDSEDDAKRAAPLIKKAVGGK
jgi:hypothetical protein